MQDRFKLRCYYPKNNKMYEVENICFKGQPSVTIQYSPVIKIPSYEVYLMQCTGLKDKNGTLIFEGDIVKIRDEIFDVIYWRGEFTAESIDKTLPQIHRVHLNWYNFCYPSGENLTVEVIGNIYENPELLGGAE